MWLTMSFAIGVFLGFCLGRDVGFREKSERDAWKDDTINHQAQVIYRMHRAIKRLKRKIWRGF